MKDIKVPNPLKWHGGKYYLASNITALMPPHIHYVEPFAGGLSVLLAKNPNGVSEVVNDVNGDLTNFWDVLKSDGTFDRFRRVVQATPFSEAEWDRSREQLGSADSVLRAVAFFVLCRQSLSGRMLHFASLSRNRVRRGMNEQASAWISAVDGLALVHERLRKVVILNRPADEVIRTQDGPNTLFYLDPPYVHDTRMGTYEYGENEMSTEQHQRLVEIITKLNGRVMLSMYHHPLYDNLVTKSGWRVVEFDLPNNSAGGGEKRRMTECVYMNF